MTVGILSPQRHPFEVHGANGFVARFSNLKCAALFCVARSSKRLWVEHEGKSYDLGECDRIRLEKHSEIGPDGDGTTSSLKEKSPCQKQLQL